MSEERWKKLDVWKLADEDYKEVRDGYERLGRQLWRFYETVRNR